MIPFTSDDDLAKVEPRKCPKCQNGMMVPGEVITSTRPLVENWHCPDCGHVGEQSNTAQEQVKP